MAWDLSEPADNTKLRLAPALIRANWSALETGDVPFDALQLQEQAADPVSSANTGFLYSKQSGTTTEAFYENDAGTIKQLTGLSVTTTSPAGGENNGFKTPWGITLNWGYGTLAGGTKTVTWAVPYNVSGKKPYVQVTKTGSASATSQPVSFGESSTQATFYGSGTDLFQYFAIGIS